MSARDMVRWFSDPPTSLNSWGVRLLIAAMVSLLLASILLLSAVYNVTAQLDRERAERLQRSDANTARVCAILEHQMAPVSELRDLGCP